MVEHFLMLRKCYYCDQVYGEKEPLDNHEETSGECDLCHFLFKIWYYGLKAGRITQPASEFISDCRKTLAENHNELRIEKYLCSGKTWLRETTFA